MYTYLSLVKFVAVSDHIKGTDRLQKQLIYSEMLIGENAPTEINMSMSDLPGPLPIFYKTLNSQCAPPLMLNVFSIQI